MSLLNVLLRHLSRPAKPPAPETRRFPAYTPPADDEEPGFWIDDQLAEPLPFPEEEMDPEYVAQPPREPADDIVLTGRWFYPASSNVHAWQYDAPNQLLTVQFKGKGRHPSRMYQLQHVGLQVVRDWYMASSPGRFYWNFFRGQYPYTELHGLRQILSAAEQAPTVVRRTLPSDRGYVPV